MKIAYCILCHKNNIILRTLIELLSKANDIYVHVDAKANIDEFAEYKERVRFVVDRENSAWGSPDAVYAIVKLLKLTKLRKYDYIVLLSGDDLPLKKAEQIREFFEEYRGKELVGVTKGADVDARLKYTYPRTMYYKNKSLFNRIRHRLKIYNKNPYFDKLPKLYKGCLWFKISNRLRDYILKYIEVNPYYLQAFRYSLNADEVFFHTIICNSEFKDSIYEYESNLHDTVMCKHYIDWFSAKERPKILAEDDYEAMKASDCLFARKMNENIDIEQFKKYFELE